MTLDRALLIAGIAAEIAFLALITRKRVYRFLPLFFIYLAWGVTSDCIMFALQSMDYLHYIKLYVAEVSIDSAIQYAVLVELTWSVLRRIGISFTRWTLIGVIAGLLALGALIWPFSDAAGFAGFTPLSHFVFRLQASISMLRILLFLLIAGGSHVLSLGWRDRELQVATGLGAYSLASLIGAILHAHQPVGADYHLVDQLVSASYALVLLYWIVCFSLAKRRRDFPPHMEGVLSALAKSAHAQREALSSSAPEAVSRRTER